MTTSSDTLQWWPTTWGRLAPGDEVQAPDGSTWTVYSAITSDGAGEWCLWGGAGSAWSPHREDEPVTARRPPARVVQFGDLDTDLFVGSLRAVLGEVEPIAPELPRPGAKRWLLCGREVCTCR